MSIILIIVIVIIIAIKIIDIGKSSSTSDMNNDNIIKRNYINIVNINEGYNNNNI
jgi:hypothetical protein